MVCLELFSFLPLTRIKGTNELCSAFPQSSILKPEIYWRYKIKSCLMNSLNNLNFRCEKYSCWPQKTINVDCLSIVLLAPIKDSEQSSLHKAYNQRWHISCFISNSVASYSYLMTGNYFHRPQTFYDYIKLGVALNQCFWNLNASFS